MDQKVEIRGRTFVPEVVTVQAGASVTWVNLDELGNHNATGLGTSVPKTRDLAPGESSSPQVFESVTEESGIEYECTIHPGMRGRVIVTAATPTNPPPTPPAEDDKTDFEPQEWLAFAHLIAAAWVYDMADDILNVLNRHRVSEDDDRSFIRETFAYVQAEWDSILAWWRELLEDPEAEFFSADANLAERQQSLELQSRERLEALGRKLRASRSRLSPLVERWPNPIRPDQVEAGPSGSVMFPGQSSSEFGKAITVNGLQKPLRDAYMDHQDFAGAAYGIDVRNDLGIPVPLRLITNYQNRKKQMNSIHYKFLALHQYSGLRQLSRGENDSHVDAFRSHMWEFCVTGEMDAPHFSWWHWLRFIDAHLEIIETGEVPDIVQIPNEIALPDEDES